MERRRLTAAAVALLSAVVVGIAAATLGQTTSRSGGAGAGNGTTGIIPARSTPTAQEVSPAPEIGWFVTAVLVVVAVLFLVGVVLYPRRTLKGTALAGLITAFVFGLGWLLSELANGTMDRRESNGRPQTRTPDGVAPGLGGSGEASGSVPDPGILGILVVGLVGLGILGVLARQARSADESGPRDTDGAALAAIGRTAGRAADRIADADATVDNEIYRAWKEMTAHLDLDEPAARTPEEFRIAALDAGMAASDVDALTDLFRAVRYGGVRPTEEREATAADALRRIEERYAVEEGSP